MEDLKIMSSYEYESIMNKAVSDVRYDVEEENIDMCDAIDDIADDYTGSLSRNLSILKHSNSTLSSDWTIYVQNFYEYDLVIDGMAYDVLRSELRSRCID